MNKSFILLLLTFLTSNLLAAEPMARIGIRGGRFVNRSTGEPFTPVGVNYYRGGLVSIGKGCHAAFSPGFYDRPFIEEMMGDVSARGFNTVRAFQSFHTGPDGIVTDRNSGAINPVVLDNVLHFLRQAQQHGLRVIFTWDTWLPDSRVWAGAPLPGESAYAFQIEPVPGQGMNSFRLALSAVRTRANAISTLISSIQKADASLLAVILAWELENEVHFATDLEPFRSRPSAFRFGGRTFDLTADAGAQDLMDSAIQAWASACAEEIRRTDPEALVSASVFTFAAVGRKGPTNLSSDQTKDARIPARPLALLRSGLDFVDIHLYAARNKSESVLAHLHRDLESVEFAEVVKEANSTGKPLLVGETGVAAHFLRQPPNWKQIHHDQGVLLLKEQLTGLRAAGFAGVLLWHYGNADSHDGEEYAPVRLLPQYGEVLQNTWHLPSENAPPESGLFFAPLHSRS